MARVDLTKRLDPQMAVALAKQEEMAPELANYRELPLERVRALYLEGRRYWNEDAPVVARVAEQRLPGPAGEIPLRIYYPRAAGPLPALVYLHGGGWIVGNLDSHDRIMRRLALASGTAVVGVDYQLAPEHKFPTALEESIAVIRHLAAAGSAWDLDPSRLAVGGDSAGANMSLAAGQALKGDGIVKALLLYYGGYGLRDSASRRLYGGPEDGLSAEELAYYMDCLLSDPQELNDPRFDLLSSELAGLPPAFIAAAELDPLHDDSIALAALLAEAGVTHRLEVCRGVLHGFLHLGRMVDQAEQALDDAGQWLADIFARKVSDTFYSE